MHRHPIWKLTPSWPLHHPLPSPAPFIPAFVPINPPEWCHFKIKPLKPADIQSSPYAAFTPCLAQGTLDSHQHLLPTEIRLQTSPFISIIRPIRFLLHTIQTVRENHCSLSEHGRSFDSPCVLKNVWILSYCNDKCLNSRCCTLVLFTLWH